MKKLTEHLGDLMEMLKEQRKEKAPGIEKEKRNEAEVAKKEAEEKAKMEAEEKLRMEAKAKAKREKGTWKRCITKMLNSYKLTVTVTMTM